MVHHRTPTTTTDILMMLTSLHIPHRTLLRIPEQHLIFITWRTVTDSTTHGTDTMIAAALLIWSLGAIVTLSPNVPVPEPATALTGLLLGRGILKIIMQKLDGLIIIQAITQMHMTMEIQVVGNVTRQHMTPDTEILEVMIRGIGMMLNTTLTRRETHIHMAADMTDTKIIGDTILVLLEALMMKQSLTEILMVMNLTDAAFTVSILLIVCVAPTVFTVTGAVLALALSKASCIEVTMI